MGSNPARRSRRAARRHKLPTRMSEYQRARQAEQPRGEVKVHAHLHGLDLNAAAELDDAGAFEGVPCEVCGSAIEFAADLDSFQHHATKLVRCAGDRGVATPPDWYAGDPELDDALDELVAGEIDPAELTDPVPEDKPPAPRRRRRDIDGNPYDTEFANLVMQGLQHMAVYQGTVPRDEIQRRRLKSRDAKRTQRAQRRARVKRSRNRQHAA